jgi:peroxiredoxin (alkyl hydroperoxide reductase subunit C)
VTIVAPGAPAPEFTLKTEDGEDFTREDLSGRTTVLVFYPSAFSPVCTDQLQVYEEALDDLKAQGAVLYGVSTDGSSSQKAFRESLNVTIPQLSDFEPAGKTNRALVIVGPDQVVTWSYLADSPGDLPGVNLIFDGLQAAPV